MCSPARSNTDCGIIFNLSWISLLIRLLPDSLLGMPNQTSFAGQPLVLCNFSFAPRRLYLHELFEQRAVVDHRRSKIFSTCFAFPQPQSNLPRRPVMIYHQGMIDRYVRGALIKIGYGIPTRLH